MKQKQIHISSLGLSIIMKKINTREDNISIIENTQTIQKEYPPSESTTLTHLESQIIVSPFKITSLNDDNKNMNNIIQ
jgi:hypothetical protein